MQRAYMSTESKETRIKADTSFKADSKGQTCQATTAPRGQEASATRKTETAGSVSWQQSWFLMNWSPS